MPGKTVNGFLVTDQTKLDDKARTLFLKKFAKTGLKKRSASAAGVTYETIRATALNDKVFAAQIEEARLIFVDLLEESAFKRAVTGLLRPIVQGGEIVTRVREFSDPLLQTLLKANDPGKFRENSSVDVSITGGVLVVPSGMTTEEWLKEYGPDAQEEAKTIDHDPDEEMGAPPPKPQQRNKDAQ